MTFGPASILAFIASVLATVVYYIAKRLALPDWAVVFLTSFFLALVIFAGPLIHLP